MSFASYPSVSDVARAHQIMLREGEFVAPVELAVSDSLRADIAFARERVAIDSSEFAVCESYVYPVIREVWKWYGDSLTVWSHMPLSYDSDLTGMPDYFVAKKSPLGHWVMDMPYLLIVEGKRDDSSRGWGQCLAAMIAAQKLNKIPGQTLYGIATTGRVWEFGKLDGSTLTRYSRVFPLNELDLLCAAINYLFEQCRLQVVGQASAA